MAAKRKKADKKTQDNSTESRNLPDEQREYEVGNKKPPKEHQFKPGESGNPKGPPTHRTNLWVWFCKYMAMTDAKLERLDRSKLSQAQQTALRLVENAKAGKHSGSEGLARHVFDPEEGKALQTLNVIEPPSSRVLRDEELATLVIEPERAGCKEMIAGTRGGRGE